MYKHMMIALTLTLCGCALPDVHGSVHTPPPVHSGAVVYRYGTPEEVTAWCQQIPYWKNMSESVKSHLKINGCMFPTPSMCVIMAPAPSMGDHVLMDTLQHEIAHCEGWTHPEYQD